jgi:hypothetical protein
MKSEVGNIKILFNFFLQKKCKNLVIYLAAVVIKQQTPNYVKQGFISHSPEKSMFGFINLGLTDQYLSIRAPCRRKSISL